MTPSEYFAELAEEVRREHGITPALCPNVPGFSIGKSLVASVADARSEPADLPMLLRCGLSDAQADALLRYFGSFAGTDFGPCQQIKLDPPKPKSTAKPALAALSIEAPLQRYHGLGFCDE